jgi:hypothetical protein
MLLVLFMAFAGVLSVVNISDAYAGEDDSTTALIPGTDTELDTSTVAPEDLPSTPGASLLHVGGGVMTIEGAGFGHGVGMSQYGAYARALDGQSYTTILNAYYTGSSIGILGGDLINPGSIYTNVASDMANTTLTVLDGPGSNHTGMLLTRLTGGEEQPTAVLNVGDTAVVNDTTPVPGATGGCEVTLTIAGVGTVWESGTCDLTVELTSGDETPAELVKATNCRTANCTFGYGTALILIDNGSPQRTKTDSGWKGFDLVVQTTLDEYTRGIAEVPFSWPMESLKTQAVAARSYAASIDVAVDHTKAGCFCDVVQDFGLGCWFLIGHEFE